jgi:molybdate transport system substrate-binding protein
VSRARLCILALTAVLLVAGCGSSSGPTLTVSAASSLTQAFTRYAASFPGARVRASFAGSDLLAAQIEEGLRPDVFAAANTKLPDVLYHAGLVEKPVVFAANVLVIAVPAKDTKVRSIADLSRPGVTLAIGSPSVPVGVYTRTILDRTGAANSAHIFANVRTEEPDVSGIVGKLTQGAVDAGFTYITDVRATHGALRAIALPAKLQPRVAYAAAVVRGTSHRALAERFVAGLLSGAGAADLRAAGFEPPPA